MSNNLGTSGAQPQKQTRFAPLYTGRWSSGIWTNRSPLRDAATTRIVEKFYGQAGDALIAGLNVEITNKLTLARRPGTSIYNSSSYTNVDRFYDFHTFGISTEQIIVMIDQANALYYLNGATKTLLFTKNVAVGAGQAYMQSVGNTLYFGDGVETQKWLQTLTTWQASTAYGTDTLPFFSTFFIDANGQMLQAIGTSFPITSLTINAPSGSTPPTVTVTSTANLPSILSAGVIITFPYGMNTAVLDGTSATIMSFPTTTSMIVSYPLPWLVAPVTNSEATNGSAIDGGTPTSGTVQPVGAGLTNLLPNAGHGNANTPTYNIDGSVLWADRGLQLENWGLACNTTVPFTATPSPNGVADIGTDASLNFYTDFTQGTSFGTNFYVVDSNNNIQHTTGGGTAGSTPPVWNTILGETTSDGSITWTLVYLGALSPQNGGYQYCVALVNSLDNTVSNFAKISVPTGDFIGAQGYQIPPGAGLPPSYRPPLATFPVINIDSQADYVAIFRTTDGEATPFLIPGPDGYTYTIPLADYIAFGYIDTTQDTQLNNLIEAPLLKENTVPDAGAINLAYHLNRIFYSVGNIVKWTSGADTPVGNGINGVAPLNFVTLPSLVTRLVPIANGLLIFTISDIYILQGNGTISNPLQGALPLLPGYGLSSYNALAVNGAIIGFFSTDNRFIILDPSSGTTDAGFPIGDQLRLNNGNPGQSWNPKNVYVTWHVQGEDQAWYLSDGVNGWYRLMSTPAPESGFTWSPFAAITGGARAVQSLETTPGVHKLLIGPATTGVILQRDLNTFADNGTAYPANAVVGSAVLTQPGQVATVAHITTDAVKIGSPISLGILVDEALPYYTGPIDILTNWVSDPPNLSASNSLWSQRFYLSDSPEVLAAMRHCQIQILFNPFDIVQNELFTLTIFGAYNQEQ